MATVRLLCMSVLFILMQTRITVAAIVMNEKKEKGMQCGKKRET